MSSDVMWTIKIDVREPSDIIKLFELLCPDNFNVEKAKLVCGDYALFYNEEPVVGIERKEISDLFESIKDNRLFHQVDLLIDYYDICYLGITKNLEDKIFKSEMDMNMIMGSLSSVVVRRDINLLWFQEEDHFIQATIKIFEKISEGKYNDVNVKRRDSDFVDTDYYHLIKIPWMNNERAEKLLDKFGDLDGILSSTKRELMEIKGIGKKRSE
ncbi:MAG: ERCC4 domain-containing protein [Promethearchaeota archaeon]